MNTKKEFPFFSQKHIQTKIYLDNAATTQKPRSVIKKMLDFYLYENASPYRGVYSLSEQATISYENARTTVADFINATYTEEVIFTSGTTEGINFVADTWGKQYIKTNDEIVLTQAEHHANLIPWQRLAKRTGAKLRFLKIDKKNFTICYPQKNIVNKRTKLVAITHHSNVLGPIWEKEQLENIIQDAHAIGARVLLDAAQSVPHGGVDIQVLDPDFLVFSGHKMVGPTGIGVLYIKKELHDLIQPYQVGGSMVYSVTLKDAQWAQAPQKFEAGTPAIAQALGLAAAIEYLKKVDMKKQQKHVSNLCGQLLDGLKEIQGIKLLGNSEQIRKNGHLVSFTKQDIHAHDIAYFLGERGVAVRAGNHCAQPLSELFEIDASLRVSFYLYNTKGDVKLFLMLLKEAIKKLAIGQ